MENFPLTTTAWTALILGALYIALTWNVIKDRRTKGIVLGDGDDKITAKRIRGHANASEQIPIALILLGFNEVLNAGWFVCGVAAILIIGRVLHAVYFAIHGTNWRFRFLGMLLTLIAQIALVIGLAFGLLSS